MAYTTVNGRICRTNHDLLATKTSTNIGDQAGRTLAV